MEPVLFKNVNILPMNEEKILRNIDLLVEDSVISKIGNNIVAKDAQVISCDNQYVMPGLCEMHTHLISKNDLDLYLPNGVTTIRNMWGEPSFNKWRDQIKAGKLAGPAIYNSGPIVDGDPPVRPAGKYNITVKTQAEGISAVHCLKKKGYDFVKVYTNLPLNIYEAIAGACKECNMKFIGHVPRAVGFENVVKRGQHSVEHMSYVLMEDIELAAKSKIWICPTIVVQNMMTALHLSDNPESLLQDERLQYIDEETRAGWEMAYNGKEEMAKIEAFQNFIKTASYDYTKPIVKNAYDAGCRFILGTDTGNPFLYHGFSLHDELALLVDCGLTEFDALKTGTINAAQCLEIEDKTGTIEKDKRADLVLLEANPLENIENSSKIAGVMKNGQWFDSKALGKMLDLNTPKPNML